MYRDTSSVDCAPRSCVFMCVQLNKCVVVCGSVLQRGHSGDGCLTSLILFNYERSRGHCLFLVGPWYDELLGRVLFRNDVL